MDIPAAGADGESAWRLAQSRLNKVAQDVFSRALRRRKRSFPHAVHETTCRKPPPPPPRSSFARSFYAIPPTQTAHSPIIVYSSPTVRQ